MEIYTKLIIHTSKLTNQGKTIYSNLELNLLSMHHYFQGKTRK